MASPTTTKGELRPGLIFFAAFATLLLAIHLPYLKMPFFWDELGQFVPSALDLYRHGSLIPRSTLPNVHPPGVMALLALVWRIFGYSIAAARLTMLGIASIGVLLSFLLAIRLSRGAAGAPAFSAVLFLIVTPLFYTQSMLVLLDMPAMTLTVLALLLFFHGRYGYCAVACTLLVLTKETGISTPLVFAMWLWFREGRRREACYFLAPATALGIWLIMLHSATGHWLGNPEFAQYNFFDSLEWTHILGALFRRVWYLFVVDGRFLGTIALFSGWRLLRGREWAIAVYVAVAQTMVVTFLGGAVLDRYLLPAFPVLYAAMAASASIYKLRWRWAVNSTMVALMVVGWFWNPPYPFPYENNLSMIEFVRLQQEAAEYLEANARDQQIASAWPFTEALTNPDFGYVEQPMRVVRAQGLHLTELADAVPSTCQYLVVYSRLVSIEGSMIDVAPLRGFLRRYFDYHPQATPEEIRAGLGFRELLSWGRRGQWIQIYIRQ